jgi:hypothetical protein
MRACRRLSPCRSFIDRQFRKAKIQNLHDAIAADDDIFRLDIAMDDAIGVRSRQRRCDLNRHIQGVSARHRLRQHSFTQGCAFDEFCGDKRSGVGLIDFVDRDDVGMVQARSGLGFLLEPLHAIGIGGRSIGQNLQRHFAIEPGVLRQIHLSHATRAQ